METTPNPETEELWELWRQDDQGNQFLVDTFLTEDEANRAREDFEARGHKQTYWTRPAAQE